MIWPAVLSGAALRVVRTAAGRRALQGVLLAGGLFALGFLCGERAHAAQGTPPRAAAPAPPRASAAAFAPPPTSAPASAPSSVPASAPSSAPASAPVHAPAAAVPAVAVGGVRVAGASYGPRSGDSDRVQAGRPDLDDATPRHGDAQAVPLDRQLPLRFVAGPTAGADATGTGDRHRDIPVSPA
ncbi:hypothetical protein ACFV5G_03485 [Streptomyces sp. NPDC059766]|uniref:hypothetical protein n=1 Tax=Streptomyces sp. NPDC059766 TaxID=3346940 RepID=UPI003651A444